MLPLALLVALLALTVLVLAWRLHRTREHRCAAAPVDPPALVDGPTTTPPTPSGLARDVAGVLEARQIAAQMSGGRLDTADLDAAAELYGIDSAELEAAMEDASTALLIRLIERTAEDQGCSPAQTADTVVLYAEATLMDRIGFNLGQPTDADPT